MTEEVNYKMHIYSRNILLKKSGFIFSLSPPCLKVGMTDSTGTDLETREMSFVRGMRKSRKINIKFELFSGDLSVLCREHYFS